MPWTSGLLLVTNYLLLLCYSVPVPKYSNEKLLKSLQRELKFDKSDDLFNILKADRVAELPDSKSFPLDEDDIPSEIQDIPGMEKRGITFPIYSDINRIFSGRFVLQWS